MVDRLVLLPSQRFVGHKKIVPQDGFIVSEKVQKAAWIYKNDMCEAIGSVW